MLKSITCDQNTFKSVRFRDGLNLIIADKTATSAQKGTRNGAGKTTLIEIIHYCLGSARRHSNESSLSHEAVQGWKFSLEFVASGRSLTATRSVGSDDLIITGETTGLPLAEDGIVDRSKWTEILGTLMFGINHTKEQGVQPPLFRDLVRYFARLGSDAVSTPFETYRKQSLHEVRFLTAFLLQLNWELALKMKNAAEQHAQLLEAKRAVEAGNFDVADVSLPKLQAEEAELESEIEQATAELKNFRVHRQYGEIEIEANRLTTEIQDLSQQNYSDRQLLEHYDEQFQSEEVPDIQLLLELYRRAGVELGDKVSVTLERAKEFHRSIVEDRQKFLQSESRSVQRAIEDRESRLKTVSDRRASLLQILQTHGALSEHEQLVSRLDALKERLAVISRRRTLQTDLNQKRLRLNVVLAELRLQTQQEVFEQAKYITGIQKVFGGFSKQLYGKWQHALEITAGKGGYEFDIEAVDRATSEGVKHCAVFCYDATLATLWSHENQQPGFLVHDSSLFDPIEERQIEQALVTMSADETPFQYICTMNTDRLPSIFHKDHPAVVLRLTDRGTTGGLLGIRF